MIDNIDENLLHDEKLPELETRAFMNSWNAEAEHDEDLQSEIINLSLLNRVAH